MTTNKAILLSVRPKYAEKLFDGTKRIELRRVRPYLSPGDMVVVYVSSPIKQIWGTFEVERIIERPIDELWSLVKDDAGISKDEFYNYFIGVRTGCGILINELVNISHPIELEDLRRNWPGFHPPQSYMYLSNSQIGMIIPHD